MASIKQRPDGTWRARYRDEVSKEHSRHFRTKRDAQRWLDEVTSQVITGMYVDPKAGAISLTSYFTEWSQRQVWAPTTAVAMNLTVAKCAFRDVELRSIRRSHVEAWVKQMHAGGYAPGTIKTRVNNVRSVLRAAVRDRLVASDPSLGVVLPRMRKADMAMRIPTPDEVAAIMTAAEDWFRPFIAFCAFAGLRLGEAAAIQLSDVDFLHRQIRVRRQVQRKPGGLVDLRPPKYGSERDIPAPDELLNLLSDHLTKWHPFGADKWLFYGKNNEPPHQNTVHYWWKTTLERAGVEGVRLHDLRHFYASGLIAAGCDVVTVQRALGHAKATTTLNTYSHLWPTADDRTRAAAGALVETVLRTFADSVRTDSPTSA
jgi:integrase